MCEASIRGRSHFVLRTGGVTHVMSRAEIIPATNIGHINYCLNMHSFSDSFDTLTLHPQFGSTLAFQIIQTIQMRSVVYIVKYVSENLFAILFSFRSQSTSSLDNVLGLLKATVRIVGTHSLN